MALVKRPCFIEENRCLLRNLASELILTRRNDLIAELNNLRTSIAALHNHKETTAYVAFTLNLAAAAWIARPTFIDAFVMLLVLFGSIALHVAMRFQLVQRRHCAQFYQVYTASIRELIQSGSDEINMPLVFKSEWPIPRPSRISGMTRLIIWRRFESFYTSDINYPTFQIVHENIVRTSRV